MRCGKKLLELEIYPKFWFIIIFAHNAIALWGPQLLKCICHQKYFLICEPGHILEVHRTNIQRKRFIE